MKKCATPPVAVRGSYEQPHRRPPPQPKEPPSVPMFRKFAPGENVSGLSQVKSSVQRGIKSTIAAQFPQLEEEGVLDELMPKKCTMAGGVDDARSHVSSSHGSGRATCIPLEEALERTLSPCSPGELAGEARGSVSSCPTLSVIFSLNPTRASAMRRDARGRRDATGPDRSELSFIQSERVRKPCCVAVSVTLRREHRQDGPKGERRARRRGPAVLPDA